ncbi:hypothetical protein DRN50_08400 [Thermococci archaeon]|nr:MAG: hypothetical protein DRN50_08400 [Thermococci archaeon]
MNKKRTFPEKFLFYFSIFLILFAVFWGLKIPDSHWIIDNTMLIALLGIVFLVIALSRDKISNSDICILTLVALIFLSGALGGKDGICVKMGYLSEEHGRYLGLLVPAFILIALLYVFITRRRKK